MGRSILLFITILVTSVYSLKAIWLGKNNATTISIIERLPLLLSPATYVYCFSFILFASLILFTRQVNNKLQTPMTFSNKQTLLLIVSCLLQILFFYEWHNEQYLIAVIFFFLSLISLFQLYITYPINKKSVKVRIPIALWFSWSLFFSIIIFGYSLVFYEWNNFGISSGLWAVMLLSLGTAIALHLRYHHFDLVTPGVFIWGYIGIAVHNGLEELFVTTAVLFLCGVMAVGMMFFKKKRTV